MILDIILGIVIGHYIFIFLEKYIDQIDAFLKKIYFKCLSLLKLRIENDNKEL